MSEDTTDNVAPLAAQEPEATAKRPRRFLRWLLIALAAVAVVLIGAVVFWWLTILGPSPDALAALESSDWTAVTETSYGWRFQPRSTAPTTGFVLVPGGHVDARSYAPLASALAARGALVSIVKVPLALAVLKPSAPAAPIEQETTVDTWVVGGHSLGGVVAASYAHAHPDEVAGLALLASYPDGSADLSASDLEASSIVGTVDGVLDWAAWSAAKPLLPQGTQVVEIEGGNHAQFGSYGVQPGDNPASIEAADQQEQAATAIAQLMKRTAEKTAKP